MKKSMLFKRAIDENIANKDLILQNVLNSRSKDDISNKSRTGRYTRLSFKLAAAFLIITAVFTFNFWNIPLIQGTKYTENNPESETAVKQKNDFTIVAYAAVKGDTKTSSDIKVDTSTKTELKPNLKIKMPSGKIKRGNVKKSYGYEVSYEGEVGLTAAGENIVSVTYITEKGELQYFDVPLMKQMEASGELYICQIPVPVDIINPNKMGYDSIKKAFSRMWNSGELDEFKNKYFNGQDINLDDYTIGFHGAPDTTGEKRYMQISKKESGKPPYFKEGLVVKAASDRNVSWMPKSAFDILGKDANIHYEDLPSDTITVSAEFSDGEIVTKTITLSFDKDGNVIAELNKK